MRRTIIITVVLCLVAVFAYAQAPASSGTAAASGPSGAPAKHTSSDHKSYHGTVASVDAAGKSFVVHPMKGADMTVKVNDKTQYFPKGKTWDDVKVDAKIHGRYKADGADNWAITVDFAAPKSAPAAKPN